MYTGLFHNCGFNSAGMMFGGGCGEQIAKWIINGTPEFHMFNFDVKRYTPDQTANLKWAEERSHESFAKNYSKIFPHDQPLSGRNFKKDPLHDVQKSVVLDKIRTFYIKYYFLH